MAGKKAIFDTIQAKELSLDSLRLIFSDLGCKRIIYKILSPNDNSKNQPYFGSHLTDLSFFPMGDVEATGTTSEKKNVNENSAKFLAAFPLTWIDAEGGCYSAPNSKLIYYPQYPEVRFSGFLLGASIDVSNWMMPDKQGRAEGRVLILGINESERRTFAFLAIPESRISLEIKALTSFSQLTNVFNELLGFAKEEITDSRQLLLDALHCIHSKGWISSQKMNVDGTISPYTARNGGGYTLEAELGILPNGYSAPDFMGWEVKQFCVKSFLNAFNSEALTLLTPEPSGGQYIEQGVRDFIKNYGHANLRIPDRFDFTGAHYFNKKCKSTNLTMHISGYDTTKMRLTNANGSLSLRDQNGVIVTEWAFTKILDHWNRKHANAAYIPSLHQIVLNTHQYSYSHLIRLYKSTNLNLFLNAIIQQAVYYDPGIKLENASTNPSTKRRSQFRVKANKLDVLYLEREDVNLHTWKYNQI